MIILITVLTVYFLINIFFVLISWAYGTSTKRDLFQMLFIGLPAYIYWSWRNYDEQERLKIKIHLTIALSIIVIIINIMVLFKR
jgi:hypothetical protein